MSVGVCLLLMVASFFSFSRWQENHYFGKVVSASGTTFSIDDKKIGVREIKITTETSIKKGRESLSLPSVGDEVFVIAKKWVSGDIEALWVRVIEERFKKK